MGNEMHIFRSPWIYVCIYQHFKYQPVSMQCIINSPSHHWDLQKTIKIHCSDWCLTSTAQKTALTQQCISLTPGFFLQGSWAGPFHYSSVLFCNGSEGIPLIDVRWLKKQVAILIIVLKFLADSVSTDKKNRVCIIYGTEYICTRIAQVNAR